MAAKGIGFVGMRTDRLAETIDLFQSVIGIPLTRRSGDGAATGRDRRLGRSFAARPC